MHAAMGFVLLISFVALALALLGDILSHDYNFCQLKLSFVYITKVVLICIRIHACLFFNIIYVGICYRILLLYAYVCQRVINIVLYCIVLYCRLLSRANTKPFRG